MGLLDAWNSVAPEEKKALFQGLLSGAFGAMAGRGTPLQAWGQGGLAGLSGYSNSLDQQQALKDATQKSALGKLQLDNQMRAAEKQKQLDALAPQFYRSPAQTALAGGGGPTVANAQRIAGPSFDEKGYIGALYGIDPVMARSTEAAFAKDNSPLTVKEGETLLDRRTLAPVFQNQKADKGTTDMQNYAAMKAQGYTGSLEQFLREQANLKAPKTSVAVNMGQKGYENESKLRNDFKQEPIYKDFADMKSAYAQIQAGIKQGTPIADTAVATKMMKLLDPGSVVRESELGIAMAASGRMDRLQNYFQMQMSGNKLTPQQRKDFGALSEELMSAATQAYNAKRSEYAGFGSRYGLDAGVLGPEASAPKSGTDLGGGFRLK